MLPVSVCGRWVKRWTSQKVQRMHATRAHQQDLRCLEMAKFLNNTTYHHGHPWHWDLQDARAQQFQSRIIQSLRSEKINNIKLNCQPTFTMPTKPWPSVPQPLFSWKPPGTVTQLPPSAACFNVLSLFQRRNIS